MEEVQVPPQFFPYDPQSLVHRVRDHWRNQSYDALHYQQEQLENAVQEHQRVANEQIKVAAALATSRTAAHITSKFGDVENDVEANFSHQQRCLSEITSKAGQALEAQRHTLVREATAETRRDAHNADTHS